MLEVEAWIIRLLKLFLSRITESIMPSVERHIGFEAPNVNHESMT